MKPLSSVDLSEQATPSAAGGLAHRHSHKAGAHGSAFREALGHALAHAPHAPDGTRAGHPAPSGAGKTAPPQDLGKLPDAAEAELDALGGEGDGGDATASTGTGSARGSGRPSRSTRRTGSPASGAEAAQENAAGLAKPIPAAHGAVAAAIAGHAAATPAPARAVLTGEGLARLAPTPGSKQAQATTSQARNAAAQAAGTREKPREREAAGASEQAPALARPEVLRAPVPAQDAPAPSTTAAPRHAAPPLPPVPAGQDVQGAVLRSAAHLKVDAGALGSIELHLRMREGAVHLRVDGEAARVVEARAGELSRALASDGLRLAIEPPSRDGTALGNGGGAGAQGEQRREAWNEAADARDRSVPATPPTAASKKPNPAVAPGGVHVEA